MGKYTFVFLLFFLLIYVCVDGAEPDVEAKAAILMEEGTGRVLWEKNAYEQMPMASTTKIMTAVVALENGNLNDMVTVSKKAALSPKVKMNLSTGEEIKLEYLLYALMLQSYNDAAVAIAEHISGSVDEFCKLMTQKAIEIGAYNTKFETPSGLDANSHYSTAYDMALIARYALNNKEFIRITNTKNTNVDSNKRSYSLVNKNRLLSQMEGAKGVKTGFTGKAGHCFVGAVEKGDMGLISVVLGSGWGHNRNQKWIDTKEILDFGFDEFKFRDIIEINSQAKEVGVNRAKVDSLQLIFDTGLNMPLSENEFSGIKVEIVAPGVVNAPIEKGQEIGIGKVYVNNKLEKEVFLVASQTIERHDLKTSLEKVLNSWFNLVGEGSVILPEF